MTNMAPPTKTLGVTLLHNSRSSRSDQAEPSSDKGFGRKKAGFSSIEPYFQGPNRPFQFKELHNELSNWQGNVNNRFGTAASALTEGWTFCLQSHYDRIGNNKYNQNN
jgi:hypothetical protein